MYALAHIRKTRLGLTQAAFAELAEVNQSTVSRWERGELSPTVEEVNRIIAGAKKLKVELAPNEFFARPPAAAAEARA